MLHELPSNVLHDIKSSAVIRRATLSDSDALVTLFSHTPQAGAISLNFERSPNFFAGSDICTQQKDIWIYEDQGQIHCVFSVGKRQCYVNGELLSLRYSSDLRLSQQRRSGRVLHHISKAYRALFEKHEWAQTVILEGNYASLKTFGSGRLNMPTYYPYGTILTHMVYLGSKKKVPPQLSIEIRRACSDDIRAMQALFNNEASSKQLFPHHDFSKVGSDCAYYRDLSLSDYYLAFEHGELVGICGLWNQKAFKRTRVVKYSQAMKIARLANNAYSSLFGGLHLPKAGQTLDYIYTHSIVVRNNRKDIFSTLFDHVYRQLKANQCAALLVGFCSHDPLNQVLASYRKRTLKSRQFLPAYGKDPRSGLKEGLFYPEIARL